MGSPTKDLRPPAPPPMHHLEPALTIANEQRQSTPHPHPPQIPQSGGREGGGGGDRKALGAVAVQEFLRPPPAEFFSAPPCSRKLVKL